MVLPKSFHLKLGQLLRRARVGQGLTQVEVARCCRTGTQFISNIERGVCSPPLYLLARLLVVLRIDKMEVIFLVHGALQRELDGECR